jgi:hypothetical protein
MTDLPSTESRGCASTTGRIVAGVLAIAFAIGLPLSLLALAWGSVLFSADEMSEIIADELVGSGALQALAVESMLEGSEAEQGVLEYLARQELDGLFSIVIPPDWAQFQISRNLENTYAWIDDDRLVPNLVLDIQPIKTRIEQGGADDLVEVVVNSWPACGAEQIEVLTRQGFRGEELPPFLCQPPEPLRTELIGLARDVVLRQVRELPNDLPYRQDAPLDASPDEIMDLKRSLRMLRGLSQSGWLLPLSALGMITALAIRSWTQLLRWWGVPMLASGLGTFLMMFISGGTIEQAQERGVLREIPFFFQSIFHGVLDRFQDAAMGKLFVLAFLITGIGLAMLISGILLRRASER